MPAPDRLAVARFLAAARSGADCLAAARALPGGAWTARARAEVLRAAGALERDPAAAATARRAAGAVA